MNNIIVKDKPNDDYFDSFNFSPAQDKTDTIFVSKSFKTIYKYKANPSRNKYVTCSQYYINVHLYTSVYIKYCCFPLLMLCSNFSKHNPHDIHAFPCKNFLQNIKNVYAIVCWDRRDMGCLLWVQIWSVVFLCNCQAVNILNMLLSYN